jgi:hypothetical protein
MIGRSINPTTLNVGARGTLGGQHAEVTGRAVLESIDGDHWYEYYVHLDNGRTIILVYEAGDWKRFEEFTPKHPITAAEAVTYRVGDTVQLRSSEARVKYVSMSRVCYSDGQTWEGVRVGSEARYFNADCDGAMIVVSWTGEEIEFYVGARISTLNLSQAFHLPSIPFWKQVVWGGSGVFDGITDPIAFGKIVTVVLIVLVFGGQIIAENTGTHTSEPPPVAPAPEVRLPNGGRGQLGGETFAVNNHALVEVDEVDLRYKRYEYDLLDEHGGHALLVENVAGNPQLWVLFRPVSADGLTPNVAGALRKEALLKLTTHSNVVQLLFLSRWLPEPLPIFGPITPRMIRYGLLAHSSSTWTLLRWDAQQIDAEEGSELSRAAVLEAFGRR